MNRRRLTAAGLLMLAFPVFSLPQENGHGEVVTWSVTATALPAAAGERIYRVDFTGRIDAGYVIYGSDFDAEIGPRPTRIKLDTQATLAPGAKLQSLGTHRRSDKVFKTEYTYFEDRAQLSVQIVAAAGASRIAGSILGQTCYEADGTCALFSKRFDLPLDKPRD